MNRGQRSHRSQHRNRPRHRPLIFEPLENRRVLAAGFAEFVDPHPADGNGFGAAVLPISTGNVVITSPYDDAGGTDAGAVYLFNGRTGALISTLIGTHENDNVGFPGVVPLTNGNYVVMSGFWNNGDAQRAGAVTFGDGVKGVSGEVSSANSLVGSSEKDGVGWATFQPVIALPNGDYVVDSPEWGNGAATDAGAVTFGNGTTGVSGVISETNSLVGTSAHDRVGNDVTVLKNGNYVISSPEWDNGQIADVGAITFGSGTSGVKGVVSTTNSLVGSSADDEVGYHFETSDYSVASHVTELADGDYVVSSPSWDNGNVSNAGAVTLVSGTTGMVGTISATNSIVGTQEGDQVGARGILPLPSGNYLIQSIFWHDEDGNGTGALTFVDPKSGSAGVVSATNSLVGSHHDDLVGDYVTVLTTGDYVVSSPYWDQGNVADVGAVTWASGTSGVTGLVSSANSFIGGSEGDQVGEGGATPLTNGNFVIASPHVDIGGTTDVGAVTLGNGVTGIGGTVSSTNSLVGSSKDDAVGSLGITPLKNGNFLVCSPDWDNGTTAADAGAATFGNGNTAVTGPVSDANSLVGDSASSRVCEYFDPTNIYSQRGVVELANGNYVVISPSWSSDTASQAGAVTFGNGSSGVAGVISPANSLVGNSSSDNVGNGGVTPLANGNYVVSSPYWSNDGMEFAGAATFGNGVSGAAGFVSESNSLVGSSEFQRVSDPGVTALPGGSYVVASTFGIENKGAVTFGNSNEGVSGSITPANSVIGSQERTFPVGVVVDTVNQSFYSQFLNDGGGRVRLGSPIDGFSHRWHLAAKPQDVNNDTHVAPDDVIAIVNYINAQKPTKVASDADVGGPYGFLDVTGDDNVVAEDVIAVINYINAHHGQQEASADSAPAQLPLAASAESAPNQQSDDALLLILAADTASAAKRRK